MRVVKAFGQERARAGAARPAPTETLYGSQMRAVRLQARYQPLLEAIPTLGQVAILALGGWMALATAITPRDLPRLLHLLAQLVAPARQLAGILTIGQQARAGMERIFQLLDLAPAIADPPGAVELPRCGARSPSTDVGFAYAEARPGAGGLRPAHRAGRDGWPSSGPAAAGKSTAAMLVSRFYDPDRGRGPGRRPRRPRRVTPASLRRQVGVVFEESFLFSDTVRANIAYGRPDATGRRGRGRRPGRPGPRVHRAAPRGLRHRRRRAGPDPFGRPAPADRAGPGHPLRPAHPHPRRRHQRRRRQGGGAHPRRPPRGHGRPDDPARRPPPLHPAPGRPHRGHRGRAGRRPGHPRRAAGRSRCLPLAVWPGRRTGAMGTGSRCSPPRGRPRGRGRAPWAREPPRCRWRTRAPVGPPASGPGLGGGGGGGGAAGGSTWPPRPSCWPGSPRSARSATSPRSTSRRESRHDQAFSLVASSAEFRRPALVGPGPGGPRRSGLPGRPGPGQDRYRQRRGRGVRWRCCSRPRPSSSPSPWWTWSDPIGGDLRHRPDRAADHAVAADPDLGAAAAAVPRLLRAGDGRPDHDPDDHRRRPVRVPDRERAARRPWWLDRDLRRRRGRPGRDQPRARPRAP